MRKKTWRGRIHKAFVLDKENAREKEREKHTKFQDFLAKFCMIILRRVTYVKGNE